MATIIQYYEYAGLAAAAYVENVDQAASTYVGAQLAVAADAQERIPLARAPWRN